MALFDRNLIKCGKAITVQSRSEVIINGDSTEVFTDVDDILGIIKTVRGVRIFDNTNTELDVTHEVCIGPVTPEITAENWLLFQGKRIKILRVEDCCENGTVFKLSCTERGTDTILVNEA